MFVVGMAGIVLGYVVVYYGVQLLFRQAILDQGATGSVWGVPFSMLLGIIPDTTDLDSPKNKRPSAPFNFLSQSSGAQPAVNTPTQPSGKVQAL